MLGILGPLIVACDEGEVMVTAAKHRTLLALLAISRNRPVPAGRIVAELWPHGPPESANENLRTYVSAVRRRLGAQRRRLTTWQGSYLLALRDDEFDASIFQRRTGDARAAMAAGRLPEMIEQYRSALALWRGEPLHDVPVGPSLSPYRTTLTEARLRAQENYLVAQARYGEVDRAITGLRQLIADHPHREPLWHTLISLLYRLGDRSAALDAFQQARASLVQDLGLDPGPELTRLHADMLKGLPLPPGEGHEIVSWPGPTPAPVPHQLPPEPAILVGRARELEQLRTSLTQVEDPPSRVPQRPRVATVHGIAGVGKSTLALTAAHLLAHEYPDGQLYLDLQGTSPGLAPIPPAEALAQILRALGTPETQISPDPGEAAATYRSATTHRRILLLLDNAIDTTQVRWLLPAGTGCGVVVTSRHRLETLDDARHLQLASLSAEDAVTLLRHLGGDQPVDRDPSAAAEVARLCGTLPLALQIIGLRAGRYAETDLQGMAARLRREHRLLDLLGLDDLSVRATFEIGYRQLSTAGQVGDIAARSFRMMGLVQLAKFTPGDIAAMLDTPESTAVHALELLVDHGLVEHNGTEHHLHDLLRHYAAELAGRYDPPDAAPTAATRIAHRLINVTRRSRWLYEPFDGDPPHDPAAEGPQIPHQPPEAEQWLRQNLASITTLSRQLYAQPSTRHVAWQLLRPLTRRLMHSYPAVCIQLHASLVDNDDRDHLPDRARALCTLSSAHMFLNRHADTARYAQKAMDLIGDLPDELRARVMAVYGTALERVGQPQQALAYLTEAVVRYEALHRPEPVAICLNNTAEITFALGWYHESLAILRRSLAIIRRSGQPFLYGAALDGLAKTHLRLGNPHAAIRYATASLTHSKHQRNTFQQVHTLQWRSLAQQQRGHQQEAVTDAHTALELARDVDSPELELEAIRHLAAIQWQAGDPTAADTLTLADQLAANIAGAPATPR